MNIMNEYILCVLVFKLIDWGAHRTPQRPKQEKKNYVLCTNAEQQTKQSKTKRLTQDYDNNWIISRSI